MYMYEFDTTLPYIVCQAAGSCYDCFCDSLGFMVRGAVLALSSGLVVLHLPFGSRCDHTTTTFVTA